MEYVNKRNESKRKAEEKKAQMGTKKGKQGRGRGRGRGRY